MFSAIGPKDRFDGIGAGVDLHVKMTSVKSLVDGREEGRTGEHVESEVVLLCEGYNNEGACDMLCQM